MNAVISAVLLSALQDVVYVALVKMERFVDRV